MKLIMRKISCFLWACCHLYESQVSLQQVFYWSVCVWLRCAHRSCPCSHTHPGVCMRFAFLLQHRDLDLQQLQHNMRSKQAHNTPIRQLQLNPCSRCAVTCVVFTYRSADDISWLCRDIRHVSIFCFQIISQLCELVSFVPLWPNLRVKYLEPHTFTLTPSLLLCPLFYGLQSDCRLLPRYSLWWPVMIHVGLVLCAGSSLSPQTGTVGIHPRRWLQRCTSVLQEGNNVQKSQAPRSDPSLWEDCC